MKILLAIALLTICGCAQEGEQKQKGATYSVVVIDGWRYIASPFGGYVTGWSFTPEPNGQVQTNK